MRGVDDEASTVTLRCVQQLQTRLKGDEEVGTITDEMLQKPDVEAGRYNMAWPDMHWAAEASRRVQ
jgi:hypothetical protein